MIIEVPLYIHCTIGFDKPTLLVGRFYLDYPKIDAKRYSTVQTVDLISTKTMAKIHLVEFIATV